MTIRVALKHRMTYDFDRPVTLFPHVLRLRPAVHSRTPIHSYSLKVSPEEHFINWQQDPFGNFLARLVFQKPTTTLDIQVEVIADMKVVNPFDFFVEEYAKDFPFKYKPVQMRELAPYLKKSRKGPLLKAWLSKVSMEPLSINDFIVNINRRLQQDIGYGIRLEPGVQTPEQTLKLRKGSCRDTSWLLVNILRHLGLAARFVSGYLVQLKSDQKSLDGPSGPVEDFTDLHAWCEVYIPGAGWVGLDPTSGLLTSEGHIPLACTPEPGSAAPVEGATSKGQVEFSFSNVVERIKEDPRVTKPYTEDEWQRVLNLGDKLDEQLQRQDVRLTMGGEPTFVSIDDMESEQWNTGALGDDKLKLAHNLLLRLHDRFGPTGMLHYGQGKWYPGEEIPRWALGSFWRSDGEPIWNNKALFDEPEGLLADADSRQKKSTTEKPATLDDAAFGRFSLAVARQLGIKPDYAVPAYEDISYHLLQEQALPANLDLMAADLGDDVERRRLARILSQGLSSVVGYVIPLRWDPSDFNPLAEAKSKPHWQTSRWPIRGERLSLLPGDSPMGLRLPLNSLPLATHPSEMMPYERDPFETRGPLQSAAKLGQATRKVKAGSASISTTEVIRTALCIERRGKKVYLFMPPMTHLEHYLALIAAIEHAAQECDQKVIIEGYEPPRDPRINKLLVTPDPGVIEVNIQPSYSWREQVQITETVYEEARQSRLSAEKFMIDGRHTGTGGGNHMTLGGSTPEHSPFLRRPDLLRSFVNYWQNHPGLSYLFSGMFIGPTSQSPRVDEGRDENLYELEIAFQQMPEGDVPQPWLVDRILRNLLIDVTGNTHRTEFCIDKLYAPGTASGRQGIVELRGFEMPPHERMSLVQAVFIRSMLARFWNEPYKQKLVRWGTELHDKFMLPHYVWADIKDVVQELNDHGYPFELQWLLPFEEFRFPHYGRHQIDDMSMELRWAIEPWHVLGEEVSSMGTARYVDSSVERLQVRLTNFVDARYALTCNGKRVPLHNTGRHGEYVAGIRYRAWQPFSALHPTIGIHAPLVFDIIDTWNRRSIGGCTYHVVHQGGRSYDSMPVNAVEAESRRHNRFENIGHTQSQLNHNYGGMGGFAGFSNNVDPTDNRIQTYSTTPAGTMLRGSVPHRSDISAIDLTPVEPSMEYPHTFDLRRVK